MRRLDRNAVAALLALGRARNDMRWVRYAHARAEDWLIIQNEHTVLESASLTGDRIAEDPCAFYGHDYGLAVYFSPAVLWCCSRCGEDIQGRTFEDLQPLTQQDLDVLEEMQRMGDL